LALELLVPDLLKPGQSDREQAQSVGAVLFFFVVDLMVNRIAERTANLKPPVVTDHPPSLERAHRLARQFAEVTSSRIAFDLNDALVLWYHAREESMLKLLDDAGAMRG
jgi:hypothetical protein